ncbi:MAG: oxidoreductase [Nocardioides sp.]
MRLTLGLLTAALLLAAPATTGAAVPDEGAQAKPSWQHVDIKTKQSFRGLAAVDATTAWVGGSEGGVWRTTDAGDTWQKVGPELKKPLLFRDVEATDADHAQVLAIGPGRQSRIYRTADGGLTWERTFTNKDQDAFYDCLAMYPDGVHGLAMSDPVDGKFRIIATEDGGTTWSVASRKGMPKAVDGEFGFAAGGTCLVTAGSKHAYFASGGGASRIFFSSDFGKTWKVGKGRIPAAEAGGVFSLAFKDAKTGIAVGGDFTLPDDGENASAYGARTRWTSGGDLGGYRSGVAWRSGNKPVAVAVGPTGSDLTRDGGKTWKAFDDGSFDAVMCAADGTCWASGAEGAVAILTR